MTNSEESKKESEDVPGFKLVKKLSTYGPGQTWKAYSERADRFVILHYLPTGATLDEKERRRFMREAGICARLGHPGLVRFLTQGITSDLFWFATELVEGMDLAQFVQKRRPITVDVAVDVISQALDIMTYLHKEGVVHRSLWPQSMLVKEESGALTALLADLGTAKCFQTAELESTVTRLGERGYPIHGFTAPEALENPQILDPRSDIYALGAILYFVLTGRAPYEAEERSPGSATLGGTAGYAAPEQSGEDIALIEKIVEEEPPSLHELKPDLPDAIVRVVERAMAREVDARYSTTEEMSVVLAQAEGPPTVKSLGCRLAELRDNLLLIEERKSKYVLEVDIPLQLEKEERDLRARIAELEAQLETLQQRGT